MDSTLLVDLWPVGHWSRTSAMLQKIPPDYGHFGRRFEFRSSSRSASIRAQLARVRPGDGRIHRVGSVPRPVMSWHGAG